ncbi:uncharacterized protein LOC136033089 [Artemia franciscana]|uniref:uncharacterized protein LOC136033089 n=1 Tax=Artemia franciscana TaxID=6661 RepID=UPI0032DA17A5
MERIAFWLLLLVSFAIAGDTMRKSIVFNKDTPDVFYCPIEKPTLLDKMIVKARPLKKLCEYEGRTLPKNYRSDCYNDVDESEFACKEKKRIMKKLEMIKMEKEIRRK